jgi:hypothetical protein
VCVPSTCVRQSITSSLPDPPPPPPPPPPFTSHKNTNHQVGRAHPQALIYPITLAATTSASLTRREAALAVLDDMRLHSSLVRVFVFVLCVGVWV